MEREDYDKIEEFKISFGFKLATYKPDDFLEKRSEILRRVEHMLNNIVGECGIITPVNMNTNWDKND